MIKLTTLTTVAALTVLSGPAFAFGNKTYNTNVQGQAQGQIQGQAQGQSQTARSNSRSNANNRNSVSNSVNVEGSASASVGAAGCTNGLSIGAPGAAIGFSLSDRDCKIVAEAQMLQSLGRPDLAAAHLSNIARVRATYRAVNAQTAPVASTRAAPRPAFTVCEVRNGKLAVGIRAGSTQAQAVAECRATR